MGFLIRLLLLVALVVGIVLLVRDPSLLRGSREMKADVGSAVHDAKAKVATLDVREMMDELKATGRVVRRKVTKAARTVEEATEDGRTTAAIKTRLALDPDLSALEISVDTTDGVVTLAGRVTSPENLAKAVQLALTEDGVREVISTLQVKPPSPAPAG
jgi:hyperosmotically inducible periplasmic protein